MAWLAAAAVPVVTSFMGQNAARDKQLAADEARKQALAQFANLEVPDIEQQKLMLQEYQLTGQMTPELEMLIQQNPTAMEQISIDPRLRAEQMSALEQMSGLAEGKMNPADAAAFELARRQSAAEAQAKEGQILQNMQQRGQGGSGAELMARLQSNQSGADRLQQAELEQAKAMQNARMAALTQQANMSGQLRTQDYGEQSNLAKAKDLINQFNTQNAQGVQQRNVGTRNQAQQLNLQNQQNTANMNTDLRNKQQISNKGLIQQNFNNQRNLASDRAGAYGTNANAADARAAQTAGMYAGVGQGISTGIAAWNNNKGQQQGNDEMTQFELDNMED
jgi:hypothetical protein